MDHIGFQCLENQPLQKMNPIGLRLLGNHPTYESRKTVMNRNLLYQSEEEGLFAKLAAEHSFNAAVWNRFTSTATLYK